MNDSIDCFFSLSRKAKLLSLRNADITHFCELLRMFSSFLLLNVEYHLLNIYWVPPVDWLQICPNIDVSVLGVTRQNWPELLSVVTLSWLQLPVFTVVYVTIFCVSMWHGKEWKVLSWFLVIPSHGSFEIFLHLHMSFLACSNMKMYFETSELLYI